MDNKKDDSYYIKKIIANIDFVLQHTEGLSLTDVQNDEVLVDSIMFRFIQIAESAHELSPQFIEKTKSLPWQQLKGIRNRIVHAYDVVRTDIIYDTTKNDLVPFKKELEKLVEQSEIQ